MAGALFGLSRRAFVGRAMAAGAVSCLLSPSSARARAPSDAEPRFRVTKVPRSAVTIRLAQLRSSPSAISQLVLESEQGCLILAGVHGSSGAHRLVL